MYFDLDDEQRAFVATVEDFAANEIAPGATERDRSGEWFAEGWRKMGQLGLLGLQFPEAYGGSGATVTTTAAAFQAFTAGGADAGIALSWVAHSVLAGTPLWQFGNEDQKRRYLAKIATGECTASYGLTEAGAGSDASSLQTTAVERGDRWFLNGSKTFITNAPIGDVFVVFASEDRSLGSQGITAFIVERGFAGLSSGRELDKMGNRTSPTGELIFQDCEVPVENVLGKRRQGFAIAKAALEWERFLMMAHSVGTMQAVLRDCRRYAQERRQFGKPIFEQPAIQAKLADMQLNVAAGELFVRRVAWLKDQQLPTPLESSSCKIFCSAAVMQTTLQGVQVLGGYGYLRENAVERAMRDAKLAEIGGGTTEIQRQVVGRGVLQAESQHWDVAYSAEQIAARCRPVDDATDVVAAALAVAENARRSAGAGLELVVERALRKANERSDGQYDALNRLFGAAAATGIGEAALEEGLAAGRALANEEISQLVEFKLADIRTRIDGARMLVHKAADRLQRGIGCLQEARIARIFAIETAIFCTEQAAAIAGSAASTRLNELLIACQVPAGLGASLMQERLELARSL